MILGAAPPACAGGPFAAGPCLGLADAAYPACFFYADIILPALLLPLQPLQPLLGAQQQQSQGQEDGGSSSGSSSGPRGQEEGADAGAAAGAGFWAGLPRIARWRQALAGCAAVRAVMAELEPAGREWLQSKLRQTAPRGGP